MMKKYGFSIIGKSHIEEGTECQDAHKVIELDNGWIIAAVADGVGSAKHSGDASKIAVETAVDTCKEYMPWDYNTTCIKSMIRTAFNYSLKQIIARANAEGNPIEEYDTTLSLVIYDGKHVIYGHSGDGAIIVRLKSGKYVEITTPQKGEEAHSVIPLRFGYTFWEIDAYEEDTIAVMLVTDGMRDILCPVMLNDNESRRSVVYTPLASFFADSEGFIGEKSSEDREMERICRFLTADAEYPSDEFYEKLEEIYKFYFPDKWEMVIDKIKKNDDFPVSCMRCVTDDKTIVSIVDTDAGVIEGSLDFYEDPDWDYIKKRWYENIYTVKSRS